jgi:hypothetical protein
MALNYDYLDTYIKNVYVPKLVDQIQASNPTTARFFGKAKSQSGGSTIRIPLWYAKNTTGGPYVRWQTASFNFEEKVTMAEFGWKYNRKFIVLDNIDILENAGDGKVIDIVDTEVNIAKQSFKDDIGTQIFSLGTEDYGTGAGAGITGLKAAIDDSTAVDAYGGITRSTNTWWKSQYDYNGGVSRALTVKLLQTMYGQCAAGIDSTDVPTLIVTTQGIFDKACSILDVSRFRDDSPLGKMGFQTIYFNGKELSVDSKCPVGYLYMINENHVWMMKNPNEFFKYIPFAFKVDQEAQVAKIRLACQLVSDECRKSGVIRAIDYTL